MKKILLILLFLSTVSAHAAKWERILFPGVEKKIDCNVEYYSVLDSNDVMVLVYNGGFTELWKSTDGCQTWDVIYSEYWTESQPTSEYPVPQYGYDLSRPLMYMLCNSLLVCLNCVAAVMEGLVLILYIGQIKKVQKRQR